MTSLFLNYSTFCWLIICCDTFSRLIIFHSRLIFHCPPPEGSFFHCSWQCLEFCSNEQVMQQTFLAIIFSVEGNVGYTNFILWYQFEQKMKRKKLFAWSVGNKWGRGELMQCISFFAFVLLIFLCQNYFFKLGINYKFVIVNSFSCIFTSYIEDLILRCRFCRHHQKILFHFWTWWQVTTWCLVYNCVNPDMKCFLYAIFLEWQCKHSSLLGV